MGHTQGFELTVPVIRLGWTHIYSTVLYKWNILQVKSGNKVAITTNNFFMEISQFQGKLQ